MSEEQGVEVRIVSKSGEVRRGIAMFSKGRGKQTVYVSFEDPPGEDRFEEFYLYEHGRAIVCWGQGREFPDASWTLHVDDATSIAAGGGG